LFESSHQLRLRIHPIFNSFQTPPPLLHFGGYLDSEGGE
jgi:hypothetical protein